MRKEFEAEEEEAERLSLQDQARERALLEDREAMGRSRQIESETFDAALVDANLGGMPVDEIAHALVRRNVPFAFVTGYDRAGLPRPFQNISMLSKPFSAASLLQLVNEVLSQRGSKSS